LPEAIPHTIERFVEIIAVANFGARTINGILPEPCGHIGLRLLDGWAVGVAFGETVEPLGELRGLGSGLLGLGCVQADELGESLLDVLLVVADAA